MLELALTQQAAVAIVGLRQVGKTTLGREVADGRVGSLYLDLEAREDRERLAEPKLFLAQYESVLVVLDEIGIAARQPTLWSDALGEAPEKG